VKRHTQVIGTADLKGPVGIRCDQAADDQTHAIGTAALEDRTGSHSCFDRLKADSHTYVIRIPDLASLVVGTRFALVVDSHNRATGFADLATPCALVVDSHNLAVDFVAPRACVENSRHGYLDPAKAAPPTTILVLIPVVDA